MRSAFTSLSRCPVCGSHVSIESASTSGICRKEFACGAEFTLLDCDGVTVDVSCPSPSQVAARAIEQQIDKAGAA